MRLVTLGQLRLDPPDIVLDLLLPSPWQVACRLWSVWREPGFFATVAFSLLRISGGFALGLVLGVLLGTIRQHTGRVWPGWVLHTVNNLLVFAAG